MSTFGSAGTRTPQQAALAAADARRRIALLPAGTIVAYTDGACRGNPGPAGSGTVLELPDGLRIEASRALGDATNNIAELTAIAVALELLDEARIPAEAPVVVFTDSKYADGVLCRGWKAKANTELVAAIRGALARRPGTTLHWLAGHVGIEGNERADELANQGVAGISATDSSGGPAAPRRAP
jgi:ribonuclease HI